MQYIYGICTVIVLQTSVTSSCISAELEGNAFPSPLLRVRLPIQRDVSRNALLASAPLGEGRALPALANSSIIECVTKAGFLPACSALLHLAGRTCSRAVLEGHRRGEIRRLSAAPRQ